MATYRSILVKVSGEILSGGGGISEKIEGKVGSLVPDLVEVHRRGVRVGVVVGGGNVIRGAVASRRGMDRATADGVGMLGTVVNGLILESLLVERGVEARVLSALHVDALVEPYSRRRAVAHLAKGRLVILVGGTGNPYLTTDTAAALRAVEIGAEVLLKATKVDGVYTADPVTDATARRFDRLSYGEVLEHRLEVMDAAAIAICRDHGVPIVVFDGTRPGNLQRVVDGETVGTVVGGRVNHE